MKRALLLAIVIAAVLHAVVPAQAPPPDALKFFKNYFVTGDYVVGGVGLRGMGVNGTATGTIQMSGAPQDAGGRPTADILAAFLYWQAVTKDITGDAGATGVTFAGTSLTTDEGPLGKALGSGTPPCWSSGGATGSSDGSWKTFTYRTDVLRFLEFDELTGKYRVNGAYQVQLPDSNTVTALGASLVVIYRDPTKPLNAIVLYDGAYTMDQSTEGMFQSIKWFYDGTSPVELTHIVGSGQANKSEILRFNTGLEGETVVAVNPFSSSAGPGWDNPTFTVDANGEPLHGLKTDVTTSVDHQGLSSYDCLTWAAVIYATPVTDTDADGLLDAWELSPPPSDPYGRPLPDLAAMGASPVHKDVFVEIGWMTTNGQDYSYGGVTKPAHSHMPTPAAIKLMGDAFKYAPVDNPDGSRGIRLHIDAGDSYPSDPSGAGDEYLIRGEGLARGGESLDEMITTPACTVGPGDPVWTCQFQQYPGTVGWKTGFRYIRDEVLEGPPPPTGPGDEDPCDLPGNTCVRRFDANRMQSFHYAFFAHAVGMPKSLNACLNVSDQANPVETPDVDGQCLLPLVQNPLYFTPRTNSGVGDFPGRDFMLSLGAFSDRLGKPGGTDFMVASTFVHELGHNLELRHGAWQHESGHVFPGPNCVPAYLSVMNYLYQLRGLLDDSGQPHIDFAGDAGTDQTSAISEAGGSDGPLAFAPKYRFGWYAPLDGSYLQDPVSGEPRTTVAGRHCDGSDVRGTEMLMVRVDAPTSAGSIDWNADGVLNGYADQDLNFNGRTEQPDGGAPELPPSFNDWANIRLNQVGAGRNIGGPFLDELGRKAFGPLSAELARADWARADWARADWARADWARADWARADWGDLSQGDLGRYGLARADWARADWARADWARADWARADWGRGDDGRGDFGGGDLFIGDPNNPGGCLDHETATLLANTPPYGFTCALVEGFSVRCEWQATNEGSEIRYALYRVEGTALAAGQAWVPLTTVTATGAASYSVTFNDTLKKGTDYLYFATAVYQQEVAGTAGEVESNPSDTSHVVGPNHVPVAVNDSYSMLAGGDLTIPAPGVLANDTDSDGDALSVTVVSGPLHGILSLGPDGRFTYTPVAGYSGTDLFTYRASDGTAYSDIATVTISVTAYTLYGIQNVPPAASSVKAKAGSTVPMKWQFKDGTSVVNSAGVHHTVTVVGASTHRFTDTDPGSSSFRYDVTTNAWCFNLQTKDASGVPYPVGTYTVTITPTTPGYLASPPSKLTLTK